MCIINAKKPSAASNQRSSRSANHRMQTNHDEPSIYGSRSTTQERHKIVANNSMDARQSMKACKAWHALPPDRQPTAPPPTHVLKAAVRRQGKEQAPPWTVDTKQMLSSS